MRRVIQSGRKSVRYYASQAEVRFRSISTETDYPGEVRFPPVSEHGANVVGCLKRAVNGLMRCDKMEIDCQECS
jgi:hypothetical protein